MKFAAIALLSCISLWSEDKPPVVDELDATRIELIESEKTAMQNEFQLISVQVKQMQDRQEAIKKQYADRDAAEVLMKAELFKKNKLSDKEWTLDIANRKFNKVSTPPAPAAPKK